VEYVVSLGDGNSTGLVSNYAIHLTGRANAEVREGNWTYQAGVPVAAGDVLRIAVAKGQVLYMKNGVAFYTSPNAPTSHYPLRAFASLWSLGATVSNTRIATAASVSQPVAWTNITNVIATLQKTGGCNGCHDAGGVSVEEIASGDGYMEFPVTSTKANYVVSLGYGNSTGLVSNYAIHLTGTANAEVREGNWTYQGGVPVAAGDVLRIAVVNGQVLYMKNGVAFHTSPHAPTYLYPLRGFASLWSTGAAVSNATASGKLSMGALPNTFGMP
jgi:hypothetical protein